MNSSKIHKDQTGFSAIEGLIIVVAAIVIAVVGLVIYNHQGNSDNTTKNSADNTPTTKTDNKSKATADPYAGWKTASSSRAGFSIKYPDSWTYNEATGSKDDVEHITVASTNFQIDIASYSGTDSTNGGTSGTICTDCKDTQHSQSFTAGKLGKINLQSITYTLDSGLGNALILRQSSGTYYLASPTMPGVTTTFRGISLLDSEQAYQNETPTQFSATPDFKTAQQILESVAY